MDKEIEQRSRIAHEQELIMAWVFIDRVMKTDFDTVKDALLAIRIILFLCGISQEDE